MDITSFAVFLAGGSLVASLLTQVLKKAFAKISKRWGALASQCVLLAASVLVAFVVFGSQYIPAQWLMIAGAIFSISMVLYEVLYKAVYQKAIKNI